MDYEQPRSTHYEIATLPFYDETLDYNDAYEVPHTVYSDEQPADWRLADERRYATGTDIPFYGDTTHRSEFVPKTAYRERTPEYEIYDEPDEVPFYAETTNRADYVPKEPIPQMRALSPEVERLKVPFYSQTTNRDTYTPKEMIERPQPRMEESRVKIPFDGTTTYKEVHAPIEIKKREVRHEAVERLQLPPLDSETTSRAVYTPKKLERSVTKRATCELFKGPPMETETTTRAVYTPKKAERNFVKRSRSPRRELPPLEGISTTQAEFTPKKADRHIVKRADYTEKQGGKQRPTRTRDHDLFPGRLDMQRRVLDPQKLHRCPAENLHNFVDSRARLLQGHWWFRGNGLRRSRSAPNSQKAPTSLK